MPVQEAISGLPKINGSPPLLMMIEGSRLWVLRKNVKCYACDQTGHFAKACPARIRNKPEAMVKEKICYHCQQPGHFVRDCPIRVSDKPKATVKEKNCYYCQQPGHFPRNCKARLADNFQGREKGGRVWSYNWQGQNKQLRRWSRQDRHENQDNERTLTPYRNWNHEQQVGKSPLLRSRSMEGGKERGHSDESTGTR